MYIEFQTTVENPLFLTGHLLHMVESEFKEWARVNDVAYTSKRYKNTYRVGFDDNRYFTLFRLSWQDLPYTEHKIIDNKW